MSKKIAVLVNEDTMQRCSCGGCLKAFMNKADSFERYADEDIELVGFTHSGGDLAKKIESFKKKGVTTVHLFYAVSMVKNENYESIAEQCAEAGFDVVGYPMVLLFLKMVKKPLCFQQNQQKNRTIDLLVQIVSIEQLLYMVKEQNNYYAQL